MTFYMIVSGCLLINFVLSFPLLSYTNNFSAVAIQLLCDGLFVIPWFNILLSFVPQNHGAANGTSG